MALTLVVHGGLTRRVATLPDMGTYNIFAAGTVLWLLASAGSPNSAIPVVVAASLTAGTLIAYRVFRRRKERL